MDDKEFKGYVVNALKQIIERQDDTDARIGQMDARLNKLQAEQKEMKNDISADFKQINKKIDIILEYVEEHEGAIVLRPLPRHPLLNLKGKYGGGNGESMTDLLLKERRSERDRIKY